MSKNTKLRPQQTIQVTVVQLLEQAEFLAQHARPSVIPLYIVDAARHAIRARNNVVIGIILPSPRGLRAIYLRKKIRFMSTLS